MKKKIGVLFIKKLKCIWANNLIKYLIKKLMKSKKLHNYKTLKTSFTQEHEKLRLHDYNT